MESLNPPLQVADWHDAGIAFQQAFKAIVDDYLEDSQSASEDAFLFSMFFTVAPYSEPVEAAIAEMDPEVEARMVAAGCIENGASAGGQVITDFASISAGGDHSCGVGTDSYGAAGARTGTAALSRRADSSRWSAPGSTTPAA